MAFVRRGKRAPPLGLAWRSSSALVMAAVILAEFSDVFFYGALVPILPFVLKDRVGIGEERLQVWTTVIPAVYASMLVFWAPWAGYIIDHFLTRRAALLLASVVQTAGVALLTVGTSLALWLAGVVLLGLSGAFVATSAMALVADLVPPSQTALHMGYASIGLSSGICVAPVLSGLVYARSGYYSVWALCYAIIGIDVILRLMIIEPRAAAYWKDTSAHASTEIEPKTEILGPRQQDNQSRSHSYTGLTALFKIATSPAMLLTMYLAMVQSASLTSLDPTLPILVKDIFDWSSQGAGLIFMATVVPTACMCPIAGYLCDRYGSRYIVMGGFLFAVPPFVLLRLVAHESIEQKALLAALLALFGTGAAFVMPGVLSNILEILTDVEGVDATSMVAQGYSLFNTTFAVGCLVGPLWGGFVVDSSGWKTMTWTIGLLLATAAPVAYWCLITPRQKNDARTQ